MTDSNVFQLSQPSMLSDPPTEVLRSGARALWLRLSQRRWPGFSRATPTTETAGP